MRKTDKEYVEEYRKTIKGFVTQVYSSQKVVSKKRNHVPPEYSKEELFDWLNSQPLFHELFNNWTLSNYIKDLKPSIDRIDNNKNYSFSNIELVTWKVNNERANNEKKNGKLNIEALKKPVIGMNIKTGVNISFESCRHAARTLGINHRNISACCNKKKYYKSAGGFTWEFK